MRVNTRKEILKIILLVMVTGVLVMFVAPGAVESPYNQF